MQRGRHEPFMHPAPGANEVLKAQERRIKVEKLKGTLVDVDKIKAALFRVARQERDTWRNWPSRVSALKAAELGADPRAMQTVLADHVRQHLSELADMVLTGE